MTSVVSNKKLSIKAQTLGGLIALAAAVALPQLVHLIGSHIGTGSALGELLLPMHLPIILAGLLCGPYAAGVAGALSPILSFVLTGMPMAAMLPFMAIELCSYGFFAGVLRTSKMPTVLKVFAVQVVGRAIKAAAILIGFFGFSTSVHPVTIGSSIAAGWAGILIQLAVIPLAVYLIRKADND
ncbi:MAG: ECF transporter S component [Oscillospiraceae bacterium]|nr:ECF transporter S component [Oscillospiraceae bacterium]